MECKHNWEYLFTYCMKLFNIELTVQRYCTKCYTIEIGKQLTEDEITKALGEKKLKELFKERT